MTRIRPDSSQVTFGHVENVSLGLVHVGPHHAHRSVRRAGGAVRVQPQGLGEGRVVCPHFGIRYSRRG